MARFGDGLATGADLRRAAEEAVADALAGLDGTPDLVCAFVCSQDPGQVEGVGARVAELTGARVLVGCSAGGVIGGRRGVEGVGAVSVFTAVLPGARLRPFHLEVLPAEGGAAVVGLPEHDPGRDEEQVALLLVDPYSFPADGFVSQANLTLPGLAVVGGLAHGPRGAGSTRLLLDGRTVGRGAVGVLIGGASARTIVSQGCRPVGPAMTVTAAQGGVVHELAGVPAVTRVERLLAELPPLEQAMASSGLSLGIAMDEVVEDHEFLVRSILGTQGTSLVVGDVVTVGQTVRLQVRDAEAAGADLRAHLAAFRRGSAQPAGGALLFSCNGRGAHLFGPSYGGADHDPAAVSGELALDGLAGFFAGGELGPVGGRNHLHGFTASLLLFPA